MWLAEVSAKAKRHNQILFSKESLLLDNLRHLIDQRLCYWMEYEKTCQLNWADFLKK